MACFQRTRCVFADVSRIQIAVHVCPLPHIVGSNVSQDAVVIFLLSRRRLTGVPVDKFSTRFCSIVVRHLNTQNKILNIFCENSFQNRTRFCISSHTEQGGGEREINYFIAWRNFAHYIRLIQPIPVSSFLLVESNPGLHCELDWRTNQDISWVLSSKQIGRKIKGNLCELKRQILTPNVILFRYGINDDQISSVLLAELPGCFPVCHRSTDLVTGCTICAHGDPVSIAIWSSQDSRE